MSIKMNFSAHVILALNKNDGFESFYISGNSSRAYLIYSNMTNRLKLLLLINKNSKSNGKHFLTYKCKHIYFYPRIIIITEQKMKTLKTIPL